MLTASGDGPTNPLNLQVCDGVLYFSATDGVLGQELWRSDGTPDGTYLLKDIRPTGSNDSYPGVMTVMSSTLYFSADDGIHGIELWRSDGTADGTYLVTDAVPGAGSGFHGSGVMGVLNGRLYFRGYDPDHGLSCGRATAPPGAPSSSKISRPAPPTRGRRAGPF